MKETKPHKVVSKVVMWAIQIAPGSSKTFFATKKDAEEALKSRNWIKGRYFIGDR